ncbi:ATPase [Tenacibaculum sp. KUL118]|nr:ATPase [Tenacibaculum sp. KUL118]
MKTCPTLLFTCLFATAYSSISIADVNYVDNSGFSITNNSESQASIEVVYSHFIQHVDMWWPKDHTWWKGALRIDEQAGGCFCESTDTASAVHMRVSYVEPNKKVVMIGGLGPLQEMGVTGALIWEFSDIETAPPSAGKENDKRVPKTKVTLTYHASGNIHFNGKKASNEEAVNLVNVVDKVQAQQLNALIAFSDKN